MIYDDIAEVLLEAANRVGPPEGVSLYDAVLRMKSLLADRQEYRRAERKSAYMHAYRKRQRAMANAASTAMAITGKQPAPRDKTLPNPLQNQRKKQA